MAIDDNTIYGLYGSQIKDIAGKIEEKQDELVAGEGITITDESGSLVISAEGTTYTAGDGINITNDVIKATNTGQARVLTTDDYNWPTTGTATGVALWLLRPGVYTWDNVVVYAASGVTALGGGAIVLNGYSSSANKFIYHNTVDGWRIATVNSIGNQVSYTAFSPINYLTSTSTNAPLSANQGKVLKDLVDSIAIRASGAPTTSTVGPVGTLYEDTTNGKLYQCTAVSGSTYTWVEVGAGGSGVIELTSADYDYPTTNPVGIAPWLLDEGIYKITDATLWTSNEGASSYRNWVIIVAKKPTATSGTGDGTIVFFPEGDNAYIRDGYLTNGSGSTYYGLAPTVVQSTGTSTTQVMSQNAVTSMVYKDPSTRQKIQLGQNAGANGTNAVAAGRETVVASLCDSGVAIGASATIQPENGVATYGQVSIGSGAQSYANYSVAIGKGAKATVKGQFDISTQATTNTNGYNNSQYRLLTGLYDPQSAHDAATKGYCDNALSGKQDALTAGSGISIADESGSLVISATATEPDTFTTNEWNALWA